jgi:hypothetical protein
MTFLGQPPNPRMQLSGAVAPSLQPVQAAGGGQRTIRSRKSGPFARS